MATDRVNRVRALAELLDFLPPPARAEHADKLDGLGLRVHPEAAVPDDEIAAIAAQLYFLAPPARTLLAHQLRSRGVKLDASAATLELLREGPAVMGAHAPQRPVRKASVEAAPMLMDMLRTANPDLAARIDEAGGLDHLTQEQRQSFGMEAFAAHQAAKKAADEKLAATDPEALA